MEYTEDLVIDYDRASAIQKLVNITGKEAYEKFGWKEDEFLSETVTFPNGAEADIRLIIPDEESYTWTEALLFLKKADGTTRIVCGEPSDEFFGEWWLEDGDGNKYIVNVKY